MTRYLFVGLGSIGMRHLENLRQITNDPILAYRSSKKSVPISKLYKVQSFFNYDLALKQKPDVVFITNPTSLHLPHAIKAAETACHIFIEKPISNNLNFVNKLYSISNKHNRLCYVGFNFRFHPTLIQIKKLLNAGKIGNVLFARIQVGQYLPTWHPEEDYRKSYSSQKKLGGGVLLTLIHEIDYAYWLFGNFKWVIATCEKLSSLDIDVEDTVAIIAKTSNGTLVELHMDYLQTPPERNCEIIGTKGKIIWNYFDNSLKIYQDKLEKPEIYRKNSFERNQMFVAQLKHFIKQVESAKTTKKHLLNDQQKSVVDVMKIIQAIKKSSKIGKKIYL